MLRSPLDPFFSRVKAKPGVIALRHKVDGRWRDYSWGEYGRIVRQTGRALIAHGVKPGDRIIILGPNRPEWVWSLMGAMAIGSAAAGIYATSTPDQVAYITDHAESTLVVVENHAQLAKFRAQPLPRVKKYVLMIGAPKAADEQTWEDFLKTGDAIDEKQVDERLAAIGPDDVASLVYTSGTTGVPKGVAVTQYNVVQMFESLEIGIDLAPHQVWSQCHGVLHRDIKPANVLFRTVDPEHDGTLVRAMVGDLGLGKALDMSSRLTMIAGTPSYVAPEQAQGEHLDARADQFSLAALAFLMLSGRPPYAHSSLSAAADPPPPPPLSTAGREFPQAVEDAVRRGLAADRDQRFPDVPAFVATLREALGQTGTGSLPTRWLPVDPELTQPGNKPSLAAAQGALPTPTPPKRRRPWWPAAVLALVLVVAGGLGGYALWRQSHDLRTFTDDQNVLSVQVTVPTSWARNVSLGGWKPPDSPTFTQSALAVGDRGDWRASGQGVFVGLMPEGKLPKTLPQHPTCANPGRTRAGTQGDPSLTSVSTGCPDASVILEHAVLVSASRLLWVQVRSHDLQTARTVLDSVRTYGLG